MSEELATDPVQPTEPWNPPAADADWGELFGDEPQGAQPSEPQAVETTPTEPAPAVAAPEPTPTPRRDEFFVATYRTKEATESAIQEKDRLINDLRGKVIALAGVDPLRKGSNGEPQPRSETSYLQDPDRYAQDLTEAANRKNYRDYAAAQARLIDEVVASRYGHLLPVMEKVGRQEALDSVVDEIPTFRDFLKSEDYSKTLDESPALKRAIQASETNPQFQSDLPELYKLAYKANLANKTPELVRGSANPAPTPTPRMPMSSQRLTPPAPSAQAAKPAMNTSAGRQQLMRELEAKGVLDQQF